MSTVLDPVVPAAAPSPRDLLQADVPLGRLAVDLPGATAVFRRLKLDFCCGGAESLGDACARRGLDADALLAELATLQRDTAAAPPQATEPLIAHILERYHRVHREQLPELVRMARRVEAVHREHPDVPRGLAALLEDTEDELLQHMAKEEQVLFPMLLAGAPPMVVHPIGVMRDEHLAHGERLALLAERTHDFTPPAEACTTWRALYAGLQQLVDDLMQHIHLENNLLFPRYERRGAPAA